MPVYTTLKGFNNIGDASISELLETNLASFLSWGFIDKGAFFNVTIPSSGLYGGNKHILRCVKDPNYTLGQVWEGYRSNWVWESGVSAATQPIQVSGVYVNNAFKPLSTVGTYKHHVNYPQGRIVFDTAIPTNSVVSAEYTYRWIDVFPANNFTWFKEIQPESLRIDDTSFNLPASGGWVEIAGNRVQLPAIAIEVPALGYAEPYALGGGHWIYRKCIMHVFTEEKFSNTKIADILGNQVDATIYLYDLDTVGRNSIFPLNENGSLASGAMTYPQIISQYALYKMTFLDNEIQKLNQLGPYLFHTPVSFNAEVVLGNI